MKKLAMFVVIGFVVVTAIVAGWAWNAGIRWVGDPIGQFYIPDRVKAMMGEELSPIEAEADAIQALDEREAEFVKKNESMLKRSGNRLEVIFADGQSHEREDCVVGCYSDEFVLYRVEDVYEQPRSVLLLVERNEYTSYELLFPSGQSIEISGPPRWSPNRKRLVDVETNEMWSVYRVELWDLSGDGVTKRFETGPAFSSYVVFDSWADDDRVKLFVNEDFFTRESADKCRRAELKAVDGQWQLTDTGAAPEYCPLIEGVHHHGEEGGEELPPGAEIVPGVPGDEE